MDVLIFFWLALAVIVGVAANTRGRSSAVWVLLAIVISPLIAGLLLLALPRLEGAIFLENQNRKVSFLRSVLIATAIVLVVLFILELLVPTTPHSNYALIEMSYEFLIILVAISILMTISLWRMVARKPPSPKKKFISKLRRT